MNNLAEKLGEVPFFPPAIQVVPRLMPLLGEDHSPSAEVAEVVRVDTGLTADILRVCNSAAFGFSIRAQTIQEAVLRMGMREIYTITTKVIAAPILGASTHENMVEGVDLWNHSLATASAAAVLAEVTGTDPEIAFTVGLLHDIGKVRLAQTVGPDYAKLIIQARHGIEPLHTLEARMWGIDHAVIGGQLMKKWNFPENIRDAVLLHHTVMGTTPNLDFAAYINIADYLAGSLGLQYDSLAPLHPPHPRALQTAEITQEEVDALRPKVAEVLTREQARFLEA